jgi:hypothetical protein
VIPAPEDVVAAYDFMARRYGVRRRAGVDLIREAMDEARSLAARAIEEPAALFFALVRRPAALPGLHAALVEQLMVNHAAVLGLALDPKGLRALHVPVTQEHMDFDAVRAWFAARLVPRPGP